MSWLVDVMYKAFRKNDGRITECTKEYGEQAALVASTLDSLYNELVKMEKEELKNGIRILHKRKIVNVKNDKFSTKEKE